MMKFSPWVGLKPQYANNRSALDISSLSAEEFNNGLASD